jgi:hypothetical protein
VGGRARFCWGFWQKRAFSCGDLVVRTWWIAWWTWCFSSEVFVAKKCAMFWGFIFWRPVLGMRVVLGPAILFSLPCQMP